MVMGLAFAYFFYLIGHHSLPSVWSYFAIEKFGWSPAEIGFSLGAVGVCMILVSILSPPFMTQTFAWFSAANAPVYFPGAPFLAAALFTLFGLMAMVRALAGARGRREAA